MLKTILEASENFCVNQLHVSTIISDTLTSSKVFIAYIDITAHTGKKYRAYIGSSPNLMQKISTLFLEEELSDEETLIDMTLETANLIIGSAKVIAEEKDENTYTIATPFFEKFDTFDFDYDQAKLLKVDEEMLIVAIKEID